MRFENIPAHQLAFPRDLELWREWQRGAHPLRRARDRAAAVLGSPRGSGAGAPALHLAWRGEHPTVVLGVDATTPTQLASVLRPLDHLGGTDVAVLATADLRGLLTGQGEDPAHWRTRAVTAPHEAPEVLQRVRAVAATGVHLPAGALAHRWAGRWGAVFAVVQHGLLTPFAPPLPQDSTLLAFSEQDAHFHTRHRPDVDTLVVGSQLLWSAARPENRAPAEAAERRPVFLGQLHGAELSRRGSARAAERFCTTTGAAYRPHPGEQDKLSRAQHALWTARGLTVERAAPALARVDAPVGSVFSTGVLEAAARGLPARVTHPAPPRWLEAFWERYGMARWNGTADGAAAPGPSAPATRPPEAPAEEPARAVARFLRHHAVGSALEGDTP